MKGNIRFLKRILFVVINISFGLGVFVVCDKREIVIKTLKNYLQQVVEIEK